MIRVDKKAVPIPRSLYVSKAPAQGDPDWGVSECRRELVEKGAYEKDKRFDDAYKKLDIKDALRTAHYGKCAYCESSLPKMFDVEHYRPKSKYWWLAYSWDNLLFACADCNRRKSDKFEIAGKPVTFYPTALDNIHELASSPVYLNEMPLLIHPELEDPEPYFQFAENGMIISDNERGNYTISLCGLNMMYLQEVRKMIWDDFKDKAEAVMLEHQNDRNSLIIALKTLIKSFRDDANNRNQSYLAFRRYMAKHAWPVFLAGLIGDK